MKQHQNFLAAGALALLALPVMAQTTAPEPVGVTPQTAQEANQKAVQRSDTGTVVRTAPAVTQRAPTSTASSSQATPAQQPAPVMRPARADRN